VRRDRPSNACVGSRRDGRRSNSRPLLPDPIPSSHHGSLRLRTAAPKMYVRRSSGVLAHAFDLAHALVRLGADPSFEIPTAALPAFRVLLERMDLHSAEEGSLDAPTPCRRPWARADAACVSPDAAVGSTRRSRFVGQRTSTRLRRSTSTGNSFPLPKGTSRRRAHRFSMPTLTRSAHQRPSDAPPRLSPSRRGATSPRGI
jgi:hypothetical protein